MINIRTRLPPLRRDLKRRLPNLLPWTCQLPGGLALMNGRSLVLMWPRTSLHGALLLLALWRPFCRRPSKLRTRRSRAISARSCWNTSARMRIVAARLLANSSGGGGTFPLACQAMIWPVRECFGRWQCLRVRPCCGDFWRLMSKGPSDSRRASCTPGCLGSAWPLHQLAHCRLHGLTLMTWGSPCRSWRSAYRTWARCGV